MKRYLPVSLFAENFDIDLKPVKNDVESELRSLKDVTNGQYKKEIASLNSLRRRI